MATKDKAKASAPAEEPKRSGDTDPAAAGPKIRMVQREETTDSPYGSYKQRPFAVAAMALSPHPFLPEASLSWEPPHEGTPDYYRLEVAGVSTDLPGETTEVYLTDLEPGSEIQVVLTAFHGDDSGMLYLPKFPIAGVPAIVDEEA